MGAGTGVASVRDVATYPFPVGGIGRRLAALAIDWFVSLGVVLVLFRQLAYGSPESMTATLLMFAAEVIIFTWLLTGSFGQRILGLAVLRVDGTRLGLGRVIVRTVLLCLVIPAVVFDSDGRGLHDKAVGSVVLRVPRGGVARQSS